MTQPFVAPISVALRLGPAVTGQQITAVLAGWLHAAYGVALESLDQEGLMVEWRSTDAHPFACQLVVSGSHDQVRRTITVLCGGEGAFALVEEAPFAPPSAARAAAYMSQPAQSLLDLLLPLAPSMLDLARDGINDLLCVDSDTLIATLREDLSPGLLVAVIKNPQDAASIAQQNLLAGLRGLAFIGKVPVGTPLLAGVELPAAPGPGSVVSIARTAEGLAAQLIPSTSLLTKPESARRLAVRQQLSAPVPFDLERRRSSAMTRLLAQGPEIDLPTALQLLDDESQRANELSNRVRDLETLLERAYDDQDQALGELEDAHSRVRYLQKAIRRLGEVPLAEREDDDDWLPESSVDALVAAREALPFLMVGATDGHCRELDAHQKRGIWAKKIWSSLRALNDYCRSKSEGRFRGDIAMYRDNAPDGAIPLLAEYAPVESKSTTDDPALVAIRTFAVPTDVHASGRAYMEQHVKIDKVGQSAPRIHLLDDSGGSTQRIYIGYVGPHLPTGGGF